MSGVDLRRAAASRRTRLRRARGTSPLVVVGVAAAVAVAIGVGLYFYLDHAQPTSPSNAVSITFLSVSGSAVGSTFFDNLSMTFHGNLSTAGIGFQLVSATGEQLSGGEAGGHCPGPMVSTCTGSAIGWFAALTDNSGRVLATYDAELWSTNAQAIASGDHLVLVAEYPLAGSSDHLVAVATSDIPVSGSVLL